MPLRIGFVGFRHAHIYDLYEKATETHGVRVVAACEEDEATRAEAVGRGVKMTHRLADDLLGDDECDVIAIGDYYGRRGALALQALAAGKHVIVDKPLCTDLAELDEIDILLLRVGITASVTLNALPGQTLSGVVSEIASTATNQQGVVTYSVRVRVQIPENLDLRDGLSAVADLVLEEQLNVLLVPEQAIFGSFEAPIVRLQTESGIVDRPVVLGNSDGFQPEVLGGLQEGDLVVRQSSQAADDPFGAFRQQFRSFGGGGGGVIIRGRDR